MAPSKKSRNSAGEMFWEVDLRPHGEQQGFFVQGCSSRGGANPAEALRANDHRVIEGGTPTQFEECVPSVEGERYYIASKFLLRDGSGKPYAVCGIVTDITERKRTELELRRSAEALREAQAALAHVSRVTTGGRVGGFHRSRIESTAYRCRDQRQRLLEMARQSASES